MPTLDDLPTLDSIVATGDDLIPVYDFTAVGSSRFRKMTLNSVMGIAPGQVTTSSATSATISTRVYVATGSDPSISLTLPPASGVLREVIIINTVLGETVTVASSVIGLEFVFSGESARFLSDGTNWYRVS
jgi:hypothetical protein